MSKTADGIFQVGLGTVQYTITSRTRYGSYLYGAVQERPYLGHRQSDDRYIAEPYRKLRPVFPQITVYGRNQRGWKGTGDELVSRYFFLFL